jgi:N-carbamoyl-L-amino-acid hydrolase
VLESNKLPIGVVPGALGQRWYDVTITGLDSHAGSTPMPMRHDALLAASRLTEEINRIALEHAPHARGTVGFMQVLPNSRNTIPGLVRFSVDMRAPNDEILLAMRERLLRHAESLQAADPGLKIEIEQVVYFPPCHFAPACVESVREAAEALGLPHMDVVSGAGHDAVYLSNVTAAGMIFVPCKDGLSHNEYEDATPEDLTAGTDVLLNAVLKHAR